MQLQINAPEIKTVYEQQLFNGKNFHVFIYNKTESIMWGGDRFCTVKNLGWNAGKADG